MPSLFRVWTVRVEDGPSLPLGRSQMHRTRFPYPCRFASDIGANPGIPNVWHIRTSPGLRNATVCAHVPYPRTGHPTLYGRLHREFNPFKLATSAHYSK